MPVAPDIWNALRTAAVFFTCVSAGSLALGFALERLLPRRRIWAVPLDPGQLRHELVGNLVFLAVAVTCSGVALASGWARLGPDSLARPALTFVALLFGFQAFYYGLHRAMHHRALVRFHRWHHVSRVTTPLSGQSMSFVEALGWMAGYIGLPIAFSYITPISLTGAVTYVGYNVFGNIVGHPNVELVPHSSTLRTKSLLSNAFIYHALHHARWQGHYSFAAALMDPIFQTEWPDWLVLHARVVAGQPLTQLRERAGAPGAPGRRRESMSTGLGLGASGQGFHADYAPSWARWALGKTFLANALGHIARRNGYSVTFTRADAMLRRLKQSRLDNSRELVLADTADRAGVRAAQPGNAYAMQRVA